MNASGLGRGEWRGTGQKEETRGRKETRGGRRKGSHAAWDKSFVAFSDSQSTDWCLLEPGDAGSVEESAREKRDQETGHHQLPGAHFAVIICTNSS